MLPYILNCCGHSYVNGELMHLSHGYKLNCEVIACVFAGLSITLILTLLFSIWPGSAGLLAWALWWCLLVQVKQDHCRLLVLALVIGQLQ
jgi:hypothetical protein